MILKSYIFCNGSNGYKQYPNDHSEKFLKRFCAESKSSHQIAVYRDGNLMYYAYSYRKSERELYGLCVVCGELCVKLQSLYEYFQNVLNNAAQKGVLYKFDESGDIKLKCTDFITEKGETEELFRDIKAGLDTRRFWEALPSEDYSIPLDAKIVFSFNEDDHAKIVDATKHYHYIFVTLDNPIPSSFSMTVKRLNAEKVQLQNELETQHKKVQELSRQKKQYKIVITLAILLFIGGLMTVFLISEKNGNINDLKGEVSLLNSRVGQLNIEIQEKTESLESMTDNRNRLAESVRQKEQRIDELESSIKDIAGRYPLIINRIEIGNTDYDGNIITDYGNTIYSSQTMYLKPRIFGIGLASGDINLKVRIVNPENRISTSSGPSSDFSVFSYTYSYYVMKGDDSGTLSGWGGSDRGHWKSGSYRIEIWYEDVCLKAKTFRIY